MHRIHRTVMPAASNETRFRKVKPTNISIPVKKKDARIYSIGESGSIHQPARLPENHHGHKNGHNREFWERRITSKLSAWGGNRTRMALRPRDFKSLVSTDSTTQAGKKTGLRVTGRRSKADKPERLAASQPTIASSGFRIAGMRF